MEIPSDKKCALLVGINYTGTSAALQGCENDVKVMSEYLISKRGYAPSNITTLTEDTARKATGVNIIHSLGVLVTKAHSAGLQEIFIHYSGHGSYTRDTSRDEVDGRDETIVPLDYNTGGMITDDQLHEFMELVPSSCRVIALFDCCHSGTILDLKWRYEGEIGRVDGRNYLENPNSKVVSNVVMLSGCKDDQTSADALIKGKWSGAMTCSFLESIDKSTTWEALAANMRAYLKTNRYTQVPRLCSSVQLTDSTPIPK